MTAGILVCTEISDGRATTMTKELMQAGQKLAGRINRPLGALVIGKNIREAAGEIVSLGADTVYLVDAPAFRDSSPDVYTAIVARACREITPLVILFGQTDIGRDVAPSLAAQLGAAVTMDCVGVDIDPQTGSLVQTRPVYGGNATAIWTSGGPGPFIVAMRPRSLPAAEPDRNRTGELVTLNIADYESAHRIELVETRTEQIRGIKLEDAKTIVSGGGGIGGPEGFKILEELAQVLGGAVAATRVPCDEGWVSSSIEVGQTGSIVTPDLYIAVGISGAVQHMIGCANSKRIVAINRDPDAHIFQEADLGIVGDYRKVVPALTEAIKKIQK